MSDYYRACASIVVFRKTQDGKVQVLLLHKPRKRDSWQFPQGGQEEGESLKEAAQRELKEEADVSVHVLGTSEKVYQYDFPASYRRFRPDNVCGQRVQYVFARLKDGETVQVDEDEIDDHMWIFPEQIGKHIRRKKYLGFALRLLEEGQALL